MYAEIIPLIRLPRNFDIFDYIVSEGLAEEIKVGQAVLIPFRGKIIQGVILKLKDRPSFVGAELKEIKKILDPSPLLGDNLLKLLEWMRGYYFLSLPTLIRAIAPKIPRRKVAIKERESGPAILPLTVNKSFVQSIQATVSRYFQYNKKINFLHYNQEKNKIAVLLKIIEKTIAAGEQVIILEPQITAVEKIHGYLNNKFSGQVAILHSQLSASAYWQSYKKFRDNEARILIGTRLAVFTSAENLGLIIIDEEAEDDYKQYDQNPRYDARDVAVKLSEISGAKIIFAAQAPRLETYYQVDSGAYEYLNLLDKTAPAFKIVNMQESVHYGNYTSISEQLGRKIRQKLAQKEKTLLLINRRGLASLVACADCHHLFKCPNCRAPLSSHEKNLECHHCGNTSPIPLSCPFCRGVNIKFFGLGAEKLEREIKNIFPGKKVVRIDQDQPEDIQRLASAEIVIGTQFFIKNFSEVLEKFSLFGIISPDTLFFRPDFRANEKIYQWLTSIINLAKENRGELIIQTFYPEQPIFNNLQPTNYDKFYQQELEERKKLGYPPFGQLVKLIYQDPNEKKASFEAQELFKKLQKFTKENFDILGPIQSYPIKIYNKYRWYIIIKINKQSCDVRELLKTIPGNWIIDRDPESLL